jgi:hypothetical protein
MDPTYAAPLGAGMFSGVGRTLLGNFCEAALLAWQGVGLAFVTAFVVYAGAYAVLARRGKLRPGGLTKAERQGGHEIAGVVGVGTAFLVQGRLYLWEHFHVWLVPLALAMVVCFGLVIWWAQRRDARLGRKRCEPPTARFSAGSPKQPPPRRL